jgi:hypothetical protein
MRWHNQWITGRYDATSDLGDTPLDPSNTQHVLRDGVAFSRQLLAEAHSRARVALNDFGLGSSVLWDDFSPFSPTRIHDLEKTNEAHAERTQHATRPAHEVPTAMRVPPPVSTPAGAPSLTAQIAAMAKAAAMPLASAPALTQPRH